MKRFIKTGLVFGIAVVMTACFSESQPNYQYMPNMYESVGYETYQEAGIFDENMEAQRPAEGSIARGWQPYGYPDTIEGYEAAKANLKSPLDSTMTEKTLAEGKALYTIYCAICHGNKGDGQGQLATSEKFLGIPAYNDPARAITEGSIYHVIYYGKNVMGSHASQLNEKERWQVVAHVLNLKAELEK